ncbi:MAG: hypothetical protein QXT46_07090 [Pyrobaculum sp.]
MKTTAVVAALAIALAAAFAAWQETATITINAQTGYIDLDFEEGKWTWTAKYVIYTAEVKGSESGNDGPPELVLKLLNMYPGASLTYATYLKNDGTLPVEVYNCNFKSIGGGFTFNDVDFDFEIQVDVDTFKGGSAPPFVLKPGERAYVVIYIRGKDNAREGVEVEAVFKCDYRLKTK